MAAGVLHDVTLGYQLLWNAQRQVAGVVLNLDARPGCTVEVNHLISVLTGLWQPQAPTLLLTTPSPTLLAALLDLTPNALARVEVTTGMLGNAAIAQRVLRAQQRGLPMVWRGEPGERPLPVVASCFTQNIISFTAEEALMALRVSRRNTNRAESSPGLRHSSPARALQIYDGMASQALAEHCLDEQSAAALLGWPMEDMLYSHRQTRIQPDQQAIRNLVKAIDADASMDDIERWIGEDPVLAYRFLRYTNSAGLGLNREIDSLRQGLTVLGLARTRSWLLELQRHTTPDRNLLPVRQAMVLRARFMAELLDAGESDALRRELYLCGLLSQIDLLLFEPAGSALHAVPLPSRVKEAILARSGPYWPYLDIAASVEAPYPDATHSRCAQHGVGMEDVNLALLRTLAHIRPG